MTSRTRVLVIHPTDQTQPKVGGIHSFVDAFIAYSPDDFEIEHVGIRVGSRAGVGAWTDAAAGGRPYRFLPVLATEDAERRARVPLGARFALALARHRNRIATTGRVLQFHRPGLALPYLRSGAGRVQVIHLSSEQLVSSGSESRWRASPRALRMLEDRVLPRMDAVYGISEQVTDAYRARYPGLARRIGFLSNWVDDRWFRAAEAASRLAARRELAAAVGAGPEDTILLAVGRLDRQKRPLLAVEALARLAPNTRLVLVGAGVLERATLERAAALGVADRVRVLAPLTRSGLADAMAGADLLLVASAHETGPTVAFEALATGLPVASTTVGRIPALLAGGRAGRVAATDDADGLAAAVSAALAVPREARVAAAVEAAAPYRAAAVLEPFYARHRELAARH